MLVENLLKQHKVDHSVEDLHQLILMKIELMMMKHFLIRFVSIICDKLGHAAKRKEKGEKDDPSRDSNHTPSSIRADVLSS